MKTSTKRFNVFGVGNAMVDILALVPDEFIQAESLDKGGMRLVDTATQASLLEKLTDTPLKMRSGGSAANTILAIAQSGGAAIYTGKVSDDENGKFYRQDMIEANVGFEVAPAHVYEPTGTCLVLTTPDAERTMCTHLGVSTSLAETDIHVDHLADSDMVYVEGYLWDVESPRQASVRTMEEAKRAGVRVSYTFSDPFLVNRFTDDFRNITREYCDVIFCNAEEIQHFIGDESLEGACRALGEMVELAFVTNGADGCFVVRRGEMTHVPGFSVKAIDTVGAGDAFAGGVLYGLTNGLDDIQAAKWGNFLASRIVTIQGARLDGDFHSKLAEVIG